MFQGKNKKLLFVFVLGNKFEEKRKEKTFQNDALLSY